MPGGRGRVHCGKQLWQNSTLPRFLLTTRNFESRNYQVSIFDCHRSTQRFHRSFRQSVSQPNSFSQQLLTSPSHFILVSCCQSPQLIVPKKQLLNGIQSTRNLMNRFNRNCIILPIVGFL